jgi:hypothetical protein
MSKHTPGPWNTLPEEVDKTYIRVRGTRLGCRYKVANVMTPDYVCVHPREAEETRANARLIAAAPDLLEALRDLVDAITGRLDGETIALHNALAVIKKAEGV